MRALHYPESLSNLPWPHWAKTLNTLNPKYPEYPKCPKPDCVQPSSWGPELHSSAGGSDGGFRAFVLESLRVSWISSTSYGPIILIGALCEPHMGVPRGNYPPGVSLMNPWPPGATPNPDPTARPGLYPGLRAQGFGL